MTDHPSRPSTLPPIPPEYDRLELLYEIQTVLARLGVEQACAAILPIVTRALRVRTAILLDSTRAEPCAFAWAAADIAPEELAEATARAREVLAYLGQLEHAAEPSPAPAIASRRFVTLPLSIGRGHVFGVFQLEGTAAFDERDLLFTNAVANQLAVALEREHIALALETSRTAVERANRRLEDLYAVVKAALEGATLDATLSAVLRATCAMFATDCGAVLLASADGKTLARRATIGLSETGETVAVGSGAAGRIAAAGTAMMFDDLDALDDIAATLRASGVRSLLGAPLRARNRLIGVVHVASRECRRFTRDELQLLELVADRIGTVVDNATLYERALAAIRSRDVVMGVVSHDLRNPLSAIQMCTDLLGMDAPGLARPLGIIKRSAEVMDRLIGDLRDVASIEAGRLSVTPRHHDAHALVREAIDVVQAAASEKAIRIDTQPAGEELAVECDRHRIVQVLTNLLSNAIKFTSPGGSALIGVTRADADHARFTVEDTGSGIRAEDLPRVFDRYWQAKETADLGTGLGLTIAKGIVDAHGGTMSVESRVAHGTTFSFTLPLARLRATSGTRPDRAADPR